MTNVVIVAIRIVGKQFTVLAFQQRVTKMTAAALSGMICKKEAIVGQNGRRDMEIIKCFHSISSVYSIRGRLQPPKHALR